MAQQPVGETASVLILSDLPLLAMGIRASLAALPGVSASVHRPDEHDLPVTIQQEDPDLVIVATACGPSPVQPGWESCPGGPGRRWLWLSPDDPARPSPLRRPGLCLRTLDPGALRQLLRAALRSRPSTPALAAPPGARRRLPHASAPAATPLSAREVEIGGLVAEGLSSQEIARRLFISPRTVEKHRANLMAKLGVSNAAGLARELVFLTWAQGSRAAALDRAARRAS